jgi:hypothetical protein
MESIRWLAEHFQKEWRVIRGAPVAFSIFLVIIAGFIFAGMEWHFSGRVEYLQAALTEKQTTIDELHEELKGESPQLAAIQARRAASRSKLLEFYVSAGPLLVLPIAARSDRMDRHAFTEEDVRDFLTREHDWETTTSDWLGATLGIAAKSHFLDMTSCATGFGANQQWLVSDGRYSDALIKVVCLRRNLSSLIETGAYDQ